MLISPFPLVTTVPRGNGLCVSKAVGKWRDQEKKKMEYQKTQKGQLGSFRGRRLDRRKIKSR